MSDSPAQPPEKSKTNLEKYFETAFEVVQLIESKKVNLMETEIICELAKDNFRTRRSIHLISDVLRQKLIEIRRQTGSAS